MDRVVDSDYDPNKLDYYTWDADEGREQLAAGLRELLAEMPKVVY